MQLVPNCNQIFINRLILARFRLGRQALFNFHFSPFTIHFIYWEQSRLRSRPAGVVETGSHKKRGIRCADAILNGKSCPFYKGGLFPSPFLPETERWGVPPSAESMFCEAKLLSLLANVSGSGLCPKNPRTFEKVRSKLSYWCAPERHAMGLRQHRTKHAGRLGSDRKIRICRL